VIRSTLHHPPRRASARAFASLALGGALAALLAACPGDDGSTDDGIPSAGTSTTDGTAATATSDSSGGTAGPAPGCGFEGEPWAFSDELDAPQQRGVADDEAQQCNPVTTQTIALDVRLVVPEGVTLAPSGVVRVLLFEYDPNAADTSADCVGGLCEALDGSSLQWTFDVPNDRPELGYYVVADVDADGPEIDACTLFETDFVTFAPAQGELVVPMTADGCA
jgi:hypothetical protein